MDSIAIEVNGRFIDLSDASVRYELVNAMFNTEIYQGDWSFPFTIPASQANLQIFGFANLIEVSNRVTEYTGTLYLYGMPKYSAKLLVKRGRRQSLQVVLSGGIKALTNASKKLSELDLGEDYILGNNQTSILAAAKLAAECGVWDTYGFTFVPFYQPNFYNGLNGDFVGVVNRVDAATGNLKGNDETVVNNKYCLVPWIFQKYILSKIWEAEGLTPSGTYWDDAEISKLLIYNNRAIDVRPSRYATRLVNESTQVLNTTGQKLDYDVQYDNALAWDALAQQYVIKTAGTHNFYIELVGQVKTSASGVAFSFHLVAGSFKVYYDGVVVDTVQTVNSSVSRSKTETYWSYVQIVAAPGDVGKTVHVEFEKNSSLAQLYTYVDLYSCVFEVNLDAATLPAIPDQVVSFKKHVPDMTVTEFLAELKKDGVTFDIDYATRTVKMNIVDQELDKDDAIDMSGKADPEYELILEESGKGFSIGYEFKEEENAELVIEADKLIGETNEVEVSNFPTPLREGSYIVMSTTNQVFRVQKNGASLNTWVQAGHYYPPYKVGRGENSLKTKMGPMLMCIATNEAGTLQQSISLMPWYDGIGSSDLFGLGINPFEPRRVFWRGYNEMGNRVTPYTAKYVLASPHNVGLNNNSTGDYTFRTDSENNLIRRNSGRFYAAVNTGDIVEYTLQMDALDFERIKASSKLYIDYNRYLVKNLSISIDRFKASLKALLMKI